MEFYSVINNAYFGAKSIVYIGLTWGSLEPQGRASCPREFKQCIGPNNFRYQCVWPL